jgi:hypothetical protein
VEQFTGSGAPLRFHRAIFELLHAKGDASKTADSLLANVLWVEHDSQDIQVEDMPRLHRQLTLLDSVRRAQRRDVHQPWGPATIDALKCINACVCSLVTDVNANEVAEEQTGDATKGKRVSKLAVQAKLLQPECIRLLKELRAKPGGGAKQS